MSEDGGNDSPPRLKRKIKKYRVLSSGSSSDSDASIDATGTRRKKLRVVTSDAESSSSGSSVVRTGTRRRRALLKLRDSDGDSDASGWAVDHSPAHTATVVKPSSGFASDSSEGNSDKCSICLLRFTDQEVGTPQTCEHIFCLDCITEWSKNVNTCPVDRMTFNSIVVRVCAGGRVLRTEPVKVVERRPSVDLLVIEDPTVCEVCGSTDHEETMLLCDGCDLGYHMQCLTPPLTEVPIDQWLCPNCDDLLDVIHLSEVDDLFSGIVDLDLPVGPRPVPLREPRNARRSSRNQLVNEEPSTSSGRQGTQSNVDLPTTSRGTRVSQNRSSRSTTRSRPTTTHRRKHKKRKSKTVVIEYELEENGKFPVTKRITRRVKKRRARRRQPRTAARRSHVLASVRARLADQRAQRQDEPWARPPPLAARRQLAGVPRLSLLGDDGLDYFSEDEQPSERASTACTVAARPTNNIISAYRQARRKMITVPSPPHASSAPDILSSILESQTLLHSKNSVVSISVDGNVNIKLETRQRTGKTPTSPSSKSEKIDLSSGEDAAKKVPSYPGQSRGGGGWGGGYRGNYHRDQSAAGNNFRGGNYDGYGGGGYQSRQGGPYQQNNLRRDDIDAYGAYSRRPHQYSHDDDHFDRSRRPAPSEANRPPIHPQNQRQLDQGRSGPGPAWQPYGPPTRHSFGGFENPLDMRMGQASSLNASMADESPPPQSYRPLPEPPVFKFDKALEPEVDKSEDERSDPGLIIDTEKYDPTEPTNDDSGDDEQPPPPPLPPPPAPPAVHELLTGLDASAINVPPAVLDTAIRQVLHEHRSLIAAAPPPDPPSDDDSDGDCPNFSIYSATSVHIANTSGELRVEPPRVERPRDYMEDLVQEDDDVAAPDDEPRTAVATPDSTTDDDRNNAVGSISKQSYIDTDIKKKTEEEYKERVSKRCPITTNTRNPIKIKLNTPSLIKRQLTLYDEEEEEDRPGEDEAIDKSVESDEPLRDTLVLKRNSENFNEDFKETANGQTKDDIFPANGKEDLLIVDKMGTDKIMDEDENAEACEPEIDDEKNNELKGDSAEVASTNTDDAVPETDEDDDSEIKDALKNVERETQSDEENEDDKNSQEIGESKKCLDDKNEDALEKLTESISETEDERSYTPCLDENKSKDTSLETEKDKGIEGLDTEMISEDEGNEMFSDNEKEAPAERSPSPVARRSSPPERHSSSPVRRSSPPARHSPSAGPSPSPAPLGEEGEILDRRREGRADDGKKKKKKDSKKEGKEKSKTKGKKSDVAFKKLSKSGKERNYRERDKEERGKGKKERRDSTDAAEKEKQKQRRKEKRKDLERYDVRTVVSDKRRKLKDAFGRDISPRPRSRSPEPSLSRSPPPERGRALRSPLRSPFRSPFRSPLHSPLRSPLRSARRSAQRSPRHSPHRSPRRTPHRSPRRSPLRSLSRGRPSPSPVRVRVRRSPSGSRSPSARSGTPPRRRRLGEPRRRREPSRIRKRRRSASRSPDPKQKAGKRRRRATSRRREPRATRKSPRRRRARRSPPPTEDAVAGWVSPPRASVDSRLLSPRTPPPETPALVEREEPRTPRRPRHRRARDPPHPSKEVFTSGDNILVSVSFKDQERGREEDEADRRTRRERRRSRRRRRRRRADAEPDTARPVAIIDLERSPFRELTPSPRNVIVLSDSEHGEPPAPAAGAAPAEPPAAGPKTPPEPQPAAAAPAAAPPAAPGPEPADERAPGPGPSTPPEPPSSPDAYDPFEPTRSASASPAPTSPARTTMTLEAAQKTNMSADDVIDRRPLSPIEKVMALLQSTRDVSPEPVAGVGPAAGEEGAAGPGPGPGPGAGAGPGAAEAGPAPTPAAPPVRIVLPEPTRPQPPKLFLAKPSPIKSDPIKPMQATKISRLPLPARRHASDEGESPYSPGSSDFGDLFEPPARRDAFDALFGDDKPRRKRARHAAAKVPVKFNRKKGKMQVGVKIDEDNLKILDDLPSSAVEMQVKTKFLKKLNRQERVVEEVKLVLKPHYNKKHVTKDEYKDILRRAVPKICHNKTGEINPTKIQALVEAYVKKFRKKHKLGLL